MISTTLYNADDQSKKEAKKLKGPVLNTGSKPDKTGDIILSEAVNFPAEGVPVTREFGPKGPTVENTMGHAILHQNKGYSPAGVLARVELNEPMDRELLKKLYPAVGGKILRTHGDKDGNRVIRKMEITHLALCVSPNVDPDIKPLEVVE